MKAELCRTPWNELYDKFIGSMDFNPAEKFRAGYIVGLCEKVSIGACVAAMCRETNFNIIKIITARYGLAVTLIGEEVWITTPNNLELIAAMNLAKDNIEAWNAIRAFLCGVSAENIDLDFYNGRDK